MDKQLSIFPSFSNVLASFTTMPCFYTYIYIYTRKLYSGLSKSNFKDHYRDVVITQCLRKIAEINEFSASDEFSALRTVYFPSLFALLLTLYEKFVQLLASKL